MDLFVSKQECFSVLMVTSSRRARERSVFGRFGATVMLGMPLQEERSFGCLDFDLEGRRGRIYLFLYRFGRRARVFSFWVTHENMPIEELVSGLVYPSLF